MPHTIDINSLTARKFDVKIIGAVTIDNDGYFTTDCQEPDDEVYWLAVFGFWYCVFNEHRYCQVEKITNTTYNIMKDSLNLDKENLAQLILCVDNYINKL